MGPRTVYRAGNRPDGFGTPSAAGCHANDPDEVWNISVVVFRYEHTDGTRGYAVCATLPPDETNPDGRTWRFKTPYGVHPGSVAILADATNVAAHPPLRTALAGWRPLSEDTEPK